MLYPTLLGDAADIAYSPRVRVSVQAHLRHVLPVLGNGAQVLLNGNPARMGLYLVNRSTVAVLVYFSNQAASLAAFTFWIDPGETLHYDDVPVYALYTGEITWAPVKAGGLGGVMVSEITATAS